MDRPTFDTGALDRQARRVLRGNDRGGYNVPTDGLYPYQWNWDSGFAAWGYATFDLRRAWFELQTLFHGQWDNGMLPHIVFHKRADAYFPGPELWGVGRTPRTSGISQPPIVATFMRAVYEADKAAGRVHLELLYGRLRAWLGWFMRYRVEDGMAAITHPWESGRDNAVDWDGAMAGVDGSGVGPYERADTAHVDPSMRPKKEDYDRYLAMVKFGVDCGWDEAEIAAHGPFRVADVGMSFILLRACRDLLALAAELDEETGEIRGWIRSLEAGAARHWNAEGGYYDSVDLRSGRHAGSLSSASFLAWFAGLDDARMLAPLERVLGAVSYAVPSNDPAAESFNPLRYWRGPVWPNVNALIAIGLAEQGHVELAHRIRRDTARLIAQKGGFAEYFNPLDGMPEGGKSFTWTAAVWLAWASPSARGKL